MAKAIASPTTIPSISPVLQVLYLPVIADPKGDYIPESRLQDLTRDCVINDIAAGTWDAGVVRVIGHCQSTGKVFDASAEVAACALYQAIDRCGYDIPRPCREFCETFLGLNVVQSIVRSAGAVAA